MSVTDDLYWITPSDVLEYLFCPRFIYFMKVLHIPQHEDRRFLVQKGRTIHEERGKTNTGYLRKKLDVIKKLDNTRLYAADYRITGVVDEVLFLADGTAAPLDYKFAFRKRSYKTYFYQGLMYCLMIEATFRLPSRRAFVCFSRDNWRMETMEYDEKAPARLRKILDDILGIIAQGILPARKGTAAKCADCTYRRLCV